jgi:two-component system response regulator VicR
MEVDAVEPVFTTGEVAKFIGVNFRTVIRWIDRGELEGYKLPGRGDHRVTRTNLVSFLNRHDIPIPEELQEPTRRVLVVDDDIPMAKAIARVLKRAGWEVRMAHDGFEAGMELAEFKPSLLCLDLRMPYMDGFKVLQLTRQKFDMQILKVLVISAQGESDLKKALEYGANHYLTKPFDNEALIDVVNDWFPIK